MTLDGGEKTRFRYEKNYRKILDSCTDLDEDKTDNFLYEDKEFILSIKGTIFSPCKNYIIQNLRKNILLIKDLDGLFSGFVLNKRKNKLYVFTDHLASHPVYYSANKFCFSSSLVALKDALQSGGETIKPDYEAINNFMDFAYYLFDDTPIEHVKRLEYGTILEYDLNNKSLCKKKYFQYKRKVKPINNNDAVERLDNLFTNAVKKQWEANAKKGQKQIALLSGGLDSRAGLLIAHELGYKPDLVVTFAQSKTSDHIIARDICRKYGFKHTFVHLDEGKYLEESPHEYILANEGMTLFTAAAHQYNAIKKLALNQHGLLHTGQIGDAILGSFANKAKNVKTFIRNLGYAGRVNPLKLRNRQTLNKICARYDSIHLLNLEQRQINGTLNSDRMMQEFTNSASPFYDRELIEFCLSLPENLLKNQRLYLDWLNKKHPHITDFKWDKCRCRPKNRIVTNIGKVITKYTRYALTVCGLMSDNMTPIYYWYKKNKRLRKNLDISLRDTLKKIQDKKFKKMINETKSKFFAVHLASMHQLLFGDDPK